MGAGEVVPQDIRSSKRRLVPLAYEAEGFLETVVAVRWRGKVLIWLRCDQIARLWEGLDKSVRHNLSEYSSIIETRYPRYVLGHSDTMCGRRDRGGACGAFGSVTEDTMLEADGLREVLLSSSGTAKMYSHLWVLYVLVDQAIGRLTPKKRAGR